MSCINAYAAILNSKFSKKNVDISWLKSDPHDSLFQTGISGTSEGYSMASCLYLNPTIS